ncbi:MAG TPA: ABC transporter substrate-binding protein [Candidatus Cloacimonetes bacterium]|nr:ABC transporter substrate-binding protein [Candidatus Cloacimonadota bacterium]HHE40485.1 ABC transporter substrate-binding protein [Candidatus Cloacimonadota bacterium]
MKKIIILSLLLLLLIFAGCSSKKDITIGALLSLTGDLSSFGTPVKVACEIAEKDINSYLTCIGEPYSFKIEFEDTQTNPIVALGNAKLMHSKGIKSIIGIQSSSELSAIKPFADENGLLVISTESTSPELAIENDFIFRLIPDDKHQALAIATLIESKQYKAVLPFWRNDAWGKGLINAMDEYLNNSSVQFSQGIAYDTLSENFDEYLARLDELVKESLKTYTSDELCIYFLAFDETSPIFEALSQYPNLLNLRWFGSDGTATSDLILKNQTAAQTAIDLGFLCPMYSPDKTEKAHFINLQITNKYNETPSSYVLAAYDACWLVALSSMVTKNEKPKELANAFIHTANSYYGSTGWTALNKAGDRKFGNYDFWEIEKKNGSYEWTSNLTFNEEEHTINTN